MKKLIFSTQSMDKKEFDKSKKAVVFFFHLPIRHRMPFFMINSGICFNEFD